MEDSAYPFPKLPNDVIVDILTWLPVKPLLKFKCVCKSWRALISSHRFVKAHLENSKLDPNSTKQRLLMQFGGNFKQLSANSMLHEPVSEAFGLSSPFHTDSLIKEVLGSCNGLLCLGEAFPIPGNANGYYRKELILWNPSTRIRKELPDFEPSSCPYSDLKGLTNYGFGYDKSSDDYKVVRFFGGNSSEPEVMLQVYSLRNDEWKTAKTLGMHYLKTSRPATFVNGKLYWIGSQLVDPDVEDSFVVCFDLETEEYEILRLPNGISFRQRWLGECGGSLRLMCFRISGSDVCSLDGCGVGNENWAKVVRVPGVEDVCGFCVCVLYLMNSPVLFLGGGSIAIFNAKDRSIHYHEIRNTRHFRVCGAYIESLVSPLGW